MKHVSPQTVCTQSVSPNLETWQAVISTPLLTSIFSSPGLDSMGKKEVRVFASCFEHKATRRARINILLQMCVATPPLSARKGDSCATCEPQ